MKIVINACYGGFSISAKAIKRLSELTGRPVFFFTRPGGFKGKYVPASVEQCDNKSYGWGAFSVPNPEEAATSQENWHEMTSAQKAASNQSWTSITWETRPEDRADLNLVRVVEELGDLANGHCSKLKVVNVPDGTDWTIEEYDGLERVAEKHETWA